MGPLVCARAWGLLCKLWGGASLSNSPPHPRGCPLCHFFILSLSTPPPLQCSFCQLGLDKIGSGEAQELTPSDIREIMPNKHHQTQQRKLPFLITFEVNPRVQEIEELKITAFQFRFWSVCFLPTFSVLKKTQVTHSWLFLLRTFKRVVTKCIAIYNLHDWTKL